jgi:hypothetical protein
VSLPWFTVCADFPDHPKSIRLGRRLRNPLAFGYVIRLWAFCVEYQQDGRFTGEDAGAMLEHACGWAGTPGELLGALLGCGTPGEAGYVEEIEGGFYVHEWVERNGAHLAKRNRDAERMRSKRAESRDCRATVAEKSGTVAGEREIEKEIEREEAKKPSAPSAPLRSASTPPLIPVDASPFVRFLAETYPDIRDPSAFEKAQAAANPGVDLLAEARKAFAWETADSTRRKHKHGPFLARWFSRQQDRGGMFAVKPVVTQPASPAEKFKKGGQVAI